MKSFVKRIGNIFLYVSWEEKNLADQDIPDSTFTAEELAVLKQAFPDIANHLDDQVNEL